MDVVEFENEKGNIKMEKSIIQRLIDAGIITKNDIDEYNKQNATGLIKQQVEEHKVEKTKQRFSKIKDGVLIKFDERDLVDGKYVVPSYVTEIKEEAFSWCDELKQVIIPNGIKKINPSTFALCNNLERVILPDSVEEIGAGAFIGCKFKTIVLPKNLKVIGFCAFYNTKLESVEIPDSVEEIGYGAFGKNENLITVSLPSNLKIIRKGTFEVCDNLREIVIPEGVESIREEAFQWCSKLTRVYLPQSLQSIDRFAFCGCERLSCINASTSKLNVTDLEISVKLPTNMRYLAYSAFYNTPIDEVVRDMALENKITQYPGQTFDETKTK